MLITMNRTQSTKLYIGRIDYLRRIDYVAQGNVAVLIGAVTCSVAIHMLHRTKQEAPAKHLDSTLRWVMPLGIYPGILLFYILFLMSDELAAAILILVLWLLGAAALTVGFVWIKLRRKRRAYARIITVLRDVDPSEEASHAQL